MTESLDGEVIYKLNSGAYKSLVFAACDRLLQEFHRFDEDLSVIGKWQGGSVTSVCRGYGTDKVSPKLMI